LCAVTNRSAGLPVSRFFGQHQHDSFTNVHSWDLTPKEAVALQKRLRSQIRTHLVLKEPERIAGVDVSYLTRQKLSVAGVVVLPADCDDTVEQAVATVKTPFPYVPGLLSFRELPAILKAIGKLSRPPDLIFVDGHGQAHPRRFGIASHLGLWTKLPAIGVGKSRLCGLCELPGSRRGEMTDLVDDGEIIGKVLRTRTGVKPVFVSVGYGLTLQECVRWTLRMAPRFRLPEPIRRADRLAAEQKTARV